MNADEPPAGPAGTEAARTTEPYFFTATPLKLAVISVVTAGIYELYWFYKNWVLIKERTGRGMMPLSPIKLSRSSISKRAPGITLSPAR